MQYTDGTMKFKIINNKSGGVFPGVILAFSGTFDSNGYPIDKTTGAADTTWHLCDGTNGTPDLRGRFILGASASHAVGTTGGEEATGISLANLPPHNFSGTTDWKDLQGGFRGGEWSHMGDAYGCVQKIYESNYDSPNGNSDQNCVRMHINMSHSHTFTTNTLGEGQPHNNMPPYYALAFIMKI